MMTNTRNTELEDTLAQAIHLARHGAGLGVRELSRRSGVAAPQISRLERGEVQKPTVETLVSLARALEWNPIPLLILAGYVDRDEARSRLSEYFADGAELVEEWRTRPNGADEIEAARRVLNDPDASTEQLKAVSFAVWRTGETVETLWDDVYSILPVVGEQQDELREIVSSWPTISVERRRRILEFARDQVALTQREFIAEVEAERAASEKGGADR